MSEEKKKEKAEQCQYCVNYKKPKCRLIDEYTSRKNKCNEFKRRK